MKKLKNNIYFIFFISVLASFIAGIILIEYYESYRAKIIWSIIIIVSIFFIVIIFKPTVKLIKNILRVKIFSKRKKLSKKTVPKEIKNYFVQIENLKSIIKKKIEDYSDFNYDFKHDVSYLKKNSLDFIFYAFNNKKNQDIIIKHLYLGNNLRMNDIRNFYNGKFKSIIYNYNKNFNRTARVVLFVFYNDRNANNDVLVRFIKANDEFNNELPIGQFRYYLIHEIRPNDFDIKRIFNPVDKKIQ